MKITIPAFENGGVIPKEYTADGKNFSPRIIITDVPPKALTLAVIVDDPDAPGKTWVHWLVWNIPANIGEIPPAYNEGFRGTNDFKESAWGGPSPPPGKPHRYVFKVYALDTILTLLGGNTKEKLEAAMRGHILDQAEWVGIYQR